MKQFRNYLTAAAPAPTSPYDLTQYSFQFWNVKQDPDFDLLEQLMF